MKPLLLRDKEFLKSLYDAGSRPSALSKLKSASDQKLNTLLKFIHMVANGDIKIRHSDFQALQKKHLQAIRARIERKESLRKLLNDERLAKLKVLSVFGGVFHELLYTLFNQQ